MTTIPGPTVKRCGRRRHHPRHTWVHTPDATDDWACDGRIGPRTSLQLLVQTPTLREVRGAGVVIAEGAMSA